MPKETTYQKNKRLLIEMEQRLALVCTNPDSLEAQSIIMNYKILKGYSDNAMFGKFADKVLEIGFGIAPHIIGQNHHYE